MKNTTLCYISHGQKTLMLHRIKKKNDLNEGKWVGVGGKLEENESPEECLLREVREETGLTLKNWQYRGIVTFVSDRWEGEYMHLFTADDFEGTLGDCSEGVLEWIDREKVRELPMWEGDAVFFRLIDENAPFFSLKLVYVGDTLTQAVLNGSPITPKTVCP